LRTARSPRAAGPDQTRPSRQADHRVRNDRLLDLTRSAHVAHASLGGTRGVDEQAFGMSLPVCSSSTGDYNDRHVRGAATGRSSRARSPIFLLSTFILAEFLASTASMLLNSTSHSHRVPRPKRLCSYLLLQSLTYRCSRPLRHSRNVWGAPAVSVDPRRAVFGADLASPRRARFQRHLACQPKIARFSEIRPFHFEHIEHFTFF